MEDFQLSENFGFFELTQTSRAELLEVNRLEAMQFKRTLLALAEFLESLRVMTGPLQVHSAFRSWELNGKTRGSSKTSQHPLGQAADISRPGPKSPDRIDMLFNEIVNYVIVRKIKFGQIIKEQAARDYGTVSWVHVSLGRPWRDEDKCGQILAMEDGQYTLLEKLDV